MLNSIHIVEGTSLVEEAGRLVGGDGGMRIE